MNLSPVRAHGESKSAYHERLKINRKDRERRLRGKVLWASCVLQNGKELLKSWLSEHPRATDAEIEKVKALYPENQLFKVMISGTYRRTAAGVDLVARKKLEKLQAQATPLSPKVLATLKKDRRKKAGAEARRVAKIGAEYN